MEKLYKKEKSVANKIYKNVNVNSKQIIFDINKTILSGESNFEIITEKNLCDIIFKILEDDFKGKIKKEKDDLILIQDTSYVGYININRLNYEKNRNLDEMIVLADYVSYNSATTFRVGGKKWKAKLNTVTEEKIKLKNGNEKIKEKYNFTYYINFYFNEDNSLKVIKVVTIPNGKLSKKYKGSKLLKNDVHLASDEIIVNLLSLSKNEQKWRNRYIHSVINDFNSIEEVNEMEEIERKEIKYLNKYFHFLKYVEDEMLLGFKTKEKIEDDWRGYYGSGISDFAVGAERVVYALFNGKAIGQANSSPVGSDMFFEVDDAFIHIDLKTVELKNIGDYKTSIFVGLNQNSYKGNMIVDNNELRLYEPSLPPFYCENDKKNKKVCLTYFVTILYDKDDLSILLISLLCMPNGKLEKIYGSLPLQAGKNTDKTRFNFQYCDEFFFDSSEKRVMPIYINRDAISDKKLEVQLSYYLNLMS